MASSKKIVALFCITLISLVAVGCSDDSSPVQTQTPIDTAPPAVPAAVNVEYDGVATVTWAANTTDDDLDGYVVTRDCYGQVTDLIATPTNVTSYEDPAPQLGINVYNVYAVDTSGNQSAVASATLVRTSQHTPHDIQDQD
jgi:hypothetical protein|nr:hypothetical protein [Candidatus Krumholzibacteria bacterium]